VDDPTPPKPGSSVPALAANEPGDGGGHVLDSSCRTVPLDVSCRRAARAQGRRTRKSATSARIEHGLTKRPDQRIHRPAALGEASSRTNQRRSSKWCATCTTRRPGARDGERALLDAGRPAPAQLTNVMVRRMRSALPPDDLGVARRRLSGTRHLAPPWRRPPPPPAACAHYSKSLGRDGTPIASRPAHGESKAARHLGHDRRQHARLTRGGFASEHRRPPRSHRPLGAS
jgi:hypothetical protein